MQCNCKVSLKMSTVLVKLSVCKDDKLLTLAIHKKLCPCVVDRLFFLFSKWKRYVKIPPVPINRAEVSTLCLSSSYCACISVEAYDNYSSFRHESNVNFFCYLQLHSLYSDKKSESRHVVVIMTSVARRVQWTDEFLGRQPGIPTTCIIALSHACLLYTSPSPRD